MWTQLLLTNSTFLIKMFGAILVLSSLTEQRGELRQSPPKYFCFSYLVISGRNCSLVSVFQTIGSNQKFRNFWKQIYQENLSEKNFSIISFSFFFFQCEWIISFLVTVSWNCSSEQKYKKCNPALQHHIQNAEKLQGNKDRIWGNCP